MYFRLGNGLSIKSSVPAIQSALSVLMRVKVCLHKLEIGVNFCCQCGRLTAIRLQKCILMPGVKAFVA